jgi:hypothetical protein
MAEVAEMIEVPTQVIEGFRFGKANADFYREVAKGTAEKFGEDSRAYQTVMNGINLESGAGSQFFFNTEAGLYLPEGERVARFDDLGRIADNPQGRDFFKGIYTDTPELILRSEQASWKSNKQVLENLVEQVRERGLEFSPDNPLVFANLELVRDDDSENPYGILLKIGEKTQIVNDTRFSCRNDEINLGNQLRRLSKKKDGLSRIYLNRSGVDSSDDNLSYSVGNGRVVVFSDAEGVAA